jgi:moderate conductance mechanosensitive channel
MDIHNYWQKLVDWSFTSGVHILLVVALALIFLRVSNVLSKRLVDFLVRQKEDPEFHKRTQTLASIIRTISVIAILVVGAMMVLKEFGIDIAPILAAAGIVGLAVGFGAQSLVKDVISGGCG